MPTHVPQEVIESNGGMVAWGIGDDRTVNGILTPVGLYQDGGHLYGNSLLTGPIRLDVPVKSRLLVKAKIKPMQCMVQ